MTSKTVEDVHVNELNKLFSDAGLECHRIRQDSVELDDIGGEEEVPESLKEEEKPIQVFVEEEDTKSEELEDSIKEEEPQPFPTPSLRKVLTEKIRKVEQHNRIHVLPEIFKSDIDPNVIPKILHTPPQKYIDILAELVGCNQYKSSLAEYWFIDTLANLLRRAQEDELDRPTQAILILWFCEWMKEIQNFDAADRQRMLRRFQENMLAAAKFVAEEGHLPTPSDVGVYYKALEKIQKHSSSATVYSVPELKHTVTFAETNFECSLGDLMQIIHYIFDLFSTDYQYNLVRSVFTFTPDYIHIESPYQIQWPRSMYAPLKPGKPKKTVLPDKDKKKKKGEVETAEYLALMELKARTEREYEEQEERDHEEYNLRSHLLPLQFAATDELFDKYWPPLIPIEPEKEPEPEVQKKGKGSKK